MDAKTLETWIEREPTFVPTFADTAGYSNIVTKDGTIVSSNVSNREVLSQRNMLRDLLAQPLDIVEVETRGVHDEDVFVGTPEKFGHTMSRHSTQDYREIRENRVYGGPIERPYHYAPPKPTKKVGKEKVYKSKELRYSASELAHDWYIMSVEDLEIVFAGGKETGIKNLKERIARRGENLHDYRVIHRTKITAYLMTVLTDGWVGYINGKKVVMGLQKEVHSYLEECKRRGAKVSSMSVKRVMDV